jgi:PKD repeat protein
MLRFTTLFFLIILIQQTSLLSQSNCGCINCSFPITNNFSGDYVVNIDSATNNDLASNTQGLCRVNLKFAHESVGQLKLQLISPAGQTVTLVSASGASETNFFTTWDVKFTGCNLPATPDANHVADWDGNSTWGAYGYFSGTYFPSVGCLENFNVGPVNGNWILRILDNGAAYPGFLLGFNLEFCDPNGIHCSTEPIVIPPGVNCENAPVYANLDGYQGSISGIYSPVESVQGFCGTLEYPQWLGFVPSTTTITISSLVGNCFLGNGIQMGVFPDCSATPIACASGEVGGAGIPLLLTCNNLIPNNTYYLLIDGFAGDVCDFQLQIIPPQFSTLAKPAIPEGFASLCMGGAATYSIPATFGATGYLWKIVGNGVFSNQLQTITTYTNTPTPVEATWSIGGGDICVAAFNDEDTSAFSCLDVTITNTIAINYPAVYLCSDQIPYQLPFPHAPISVSGTYTATLPSSNACDTIVSITAFVNNAPLDVYVPAIILLNDQCYSLPSGQQLCESGTFVFQENASPTCTTNFHYDITKIKAAPLVFACVPVSVPFIATGPQANNLQWTFTGGNPADTVGSQVEVYYTAAGSYGFFVQLGNNVLSFPNLFNLGDRPEADFTVQQDENTFTLFDSSMGSPNMFNWTFGDGTTATGNAQIHDFTDYGVYDITMIASNACGSDTITKTVSWLVGTQNPILNQADIEIFPNPNAGDFHVKIKNAGFVPYQISLMNVLGQTIETSEVSLVNDAWIGGFSLKTKEKGVVYVVVKTDLGNVVRRVVVE